MILSLVKVTMEINAAYLIPATLCVLYPSNRREN